MAQRIKTVQESDLRMLGDLARSIQRVLPVTQADIDAAAALGKGWVVTRVFEVSDPLDNLRGGTQLVIRQNSIQPGQNVRRVIFVSGPGGQTVVIRGTDYIVLPDAIANSLQYVKAFGGTEQRNLPTEYTQVEYLGSDGTQYIDTGIVLKSEATITMVTQATSFAGTGPFVFWGFLGTGNLPRWSWSIFNYAWLTDLNATTSAGNADTNKHTFINNAYYDNDSLKYESFLDGIRLTQATAVPSVATYTSNTLSAYLFARNNNGTAGNFLSCRIFSYEIVQDGVKVLSLIPCRRNSDNVLGMYDTVTGNFLTNAGTGTFAAGPEAVPTPDAPMDIVSNNGVLKATHQSGLPLGYKLVDYIKATAMIELDTLTNNTMEFVARFYREGSNAQYLYQSDTTSGGTTNTTAYMSSGGNWRFGSRTAAIDVGTGVMITSVQNASGVWLNDEQVGTYEGVTAFTSTNNLRLFGTTQATPQLRLYGLKVYQNGALFYDLLPCQRESDSAYGVYDLVRGQFFTNTDATITTGSFVSDPVGIYTDGTVETISAHSKNLLDMATENIVLGKYINTSGAVLDSGQNFYNSKYIPVVAGGVYAWSTSSSVSYFSVMEYDSGYVFKKRTLFSNAGTSGSITLRSDTAFVLIGSNIDGTDATIDKVAAVDWQFEQGSTATDYVPYYDGGTATAEMLLKVGDYQDEQEILSGAITRKVGVKVFDGTENWAYVSGMNSVFTTIIATNIATTRALCSHFEWFNGSVSDMPNYSMCIPGTVVFRNDGVATLSDWKQWLADQYNAGTPVIVLYPLATPTTESVAGQTLQVQDGDNVLEITQASLNGLELEAQYKAAVSLTIQEVQDANLDNNVTVTIS